MVQEMCARMGAVTGKGLADLIRERLAVRWTAVVMWPLLIANGGVTVSEFVGIAPPRALWDPSSCRFRSRRSASGGWWSKVLSRVERAFS